MTAATNYKAMLQTLQAAAFPYVSSSTVSGYVQHTWNLKPNSSDTFVSSFISIKNNGPNQIKVGFTENGIKGSNYFTLADDTSATFPIVAEGVWLSGSNDTVEVLAGYTIENFTNQLPAISASNNFPGVG